MPVPPDLIILLPPGNRGNVCIVPWRARDDQSARVPRCRSHLLSGRQTHRAVTAKRSALFTISFCKAPRGSYAPRDEAPGAGPLSRRCNILFSHHTNEQCDLLHSASNYSNLAPCPVLRTAGRPRGLSSRGRLVRRILSDYFARQAVASGWLTTPVKRICAPPS